MARNYPHVQTFVDQMWPHAVRVGDQYGINPVTILTQAALETEWGKKVAGNNYFGVKSHGQPGGQTITTHEEINGQRVKVRDSFRKYDSMAESVEDYARFLRSNPRYQQALSSPDYRQQLSGIAAAGYATDSKYPQKVAGVANLVTRAAPPTPPGSIPNMVATALDVTPPRTPVPATPTPDLQASRAQPNQRDVAFPQARPQTAMDVLRTAQMGTPDMAAINALYARPQQPITTNDLIWGRGISDTVEGTAAMQQQDLAAALEARLRPPARTAAQMAPIYAQGGPTRPQSSPRPITDADLFSGRGISDTAERTAAMQPQALASALEQYLRPPVQQTPRSVTEMAATYAQGGPTRPVQNAPRRSAAPQQLQAASLGPSWTAADGPAARTPAPRAAQSAPQRQPVQMAQGPVSYAAQDRAGPQAQRLPTIGPTGGPSLNTAPTPAQQPLDIAVRRAPGQTIATIPTTTQSGIGQPPATRVVQSVAAPVQKAVQSIASSIPQNSLSRDSIAYRQAGMATAANPAPAQRSMAQMASLYSQGGPTQPVKAAAPAPVYGPNNPTVKGQERLAPGSIRVATRGIPESTPIMVGAGAQAPLAPMAVAQIAPMPLPYSARPLAVASELSVTPPVMRNVPPPRARPPQMAQPLRITVAGANMLQGPPMSIAAPRTPTVQQQVAQMAAAGLLNPASALALSDGRSSYVSQGGGLQPTRAMNGNIRYTYGDSAGSGGGSLMD